MQIRMRNSGKVRYKSYFKSATLFINLYILPLRDMEKIPTWAGTSCLFILKSLCAFSGIRKPSVPTFNHGLTPLGPRLSRVSSQNSNYNFIQCYRYSCTANVTQWCCSYTSHFILCVPNAFMLLPGGFKQAKFFSYLFETMPKQNLFSIVIAEEEMSAFSCSTKDT